MVGLVADDGGRRGIGELLRTERPSIGELLTTVAGTVMAVPVVLGFVALGGVVFASRAILGFAGGLRSRDARGRASRRKARTARRATPPPVAR